MVFVADDKVHFLSPGICFVVVNIAEVVCTSAEKFDVNNVFQPPADVFSGHRVLTVVLETEIYNIGFLAPDPVLALEGVLGEYLDQNSLTEVVRVFLAGFVADTEDAGHVIVVDFLASVVDQMICNLSESINVADLETALDVLFQNGADKTRFTTNSDSLSSVVHFP